MRGGCDRQGASWRRRPHPGAAIAAVCAQVAVHLVHRLGRVLLAPPERAVRQRGAALVAHAVAGEPRARVLAQTLHQARPRAAPDQRGPGMGAAAALQGGADARAGAAHWRTGQQVALGHPGGASQRRVLSYCRRGAAQAAALWADMEQTCLATAQLQRGGGSDQETGHQARQHNEHHELRWWPSTRLPSCSPRRCFGGGQEPHHPCQAAAWLVAAAVPPPAPGAGRSAFGRCRSIGSLVWGLLQRAQIERCLLLLALVASHKLGQRMPLARGEIYLS